MANQPNPKLIIQGLILEDLPTRGPIRPKHQLEPPAMVDMVPLTLASNPIQAMTNLVPVAMINPKAEIMTLARTDKTKVGPTMASQIKIDLTMAPQTGARPNTANLIKVDQAEIWTNTKMTTAEDLTLGMLMADQTTVDPLLEVRAMEVMALVA